MEFILSVVLFIVLLKLDKDMYIMVGALLAAAFACILSSYIPGIAFIVAGIIVFKE